MHISLKCLGFLNLKLGFACFKIQLRKKKKNRIYEDLPVLRKRFQYLTIQSPHLTTSYINGTFILSSHNAFIHILFPSEAFLKIVSYISYLQHSVN